MTSRPGGRAAHHHAYALSSQKPVVMQEPCAALPFFLLLGHLSKVTVGTTAIALLSTQTPVRLQCRNGETARWTTGFLPSPSLSRRPHRMLFVD
jgi:hypothetical protein